MTIREAISRLDDQKPNRFVNADKIAWLSRLDFRAYDDIMRVHADPPAPFRGYGPSTPLDTPLLIGEPYDEIYPMYMMAEIDFLDGEYTRYNNECDRFNRTFADWADYYHDTHLPQSDLCVQLFGGVRRWR